MEDESLFEKVLRVETKDIFVDLKKNRNGVYLKISERNGATRNTVLIPASGLERLKNVLDDAINSAKDRGINSSTRVRKPRPVDPETRVRSVYVSGLSWNTSNDDLLQHMSAAGPCLKATVLRVKNKRSLGCGVVEYDSYETAVHAVKVLNDTELDGRKIHCREDRDSGNGEVEGEGDGDEDFPPPPIPAMKEHSNKEKEPSSKQSGEKILDVCKVFCTNLTWDTTTEELSLHLSTSGEVLDAEILIRNGRSLGCGYVEFSNPASVGMAIAQLNGLPLKGRPVVIREYYQ